MNILITIAFIIIIPCLSLALWHAFVSNNYEP